MIMRMWLLLDLLQKTRHLLLLQFSIASCILSPNHPLIKDPRCQTEGFATEPSTSSCRWQQWKLPNVCTQCTCIWPASLSCLQGKIALACTGGCFLVFVLGTWCVSGWTLALPCAWCLHFYAKTYFGITITQDQLLIIGKKPGEENIYSFFQKQYYLLHQILYGCVIR